VNEKIEGWFRVCAAAGLDGHQGVLIPARNQRNLMLDHAVLDAVEQGKFHIYTATHIRDGLALLTGRASGLSTEPAAVGYTADSLLGLAEQTLLAYRRACKMAGQGRAPRRPRSLG
jgi:predicted ATP-dependent protease